MIIVQRWKGHIDFKEVQLCYSRFHSISKESEPELSSSLISRFSLVSLSPHIESPLHSARRILLIPSQLTRPVPQKESATTLVSVVIHRTRRMTTTVFLICFCPGFSVLIYQPSNTGAPNIPIFSYYIPFKYHVTKWESNGMAYMKPESAQYYH